MILHLGNDVLATEEDAVDIDRKFVAEGFERQILDRPMGGDPGIVDEDIDAAEAAERREPFLFLRHVELDEALAEFGGECLARGDVDVGDDHARALGDEAANDVEAEPRRAAGDKGHLARDPSACCCHVILPLYRGTIILREGRGDYLLR